MRNRAWQLGRVASPLLAAFSSTKSCSCPFPVGVTAATRLISHIHTYARTLLSNHALLIVPNIGLFSLIPVTRHCNCTQHSCPLHSEAIATSHKPEPVCFDSDG
mmetsp:Transcript_49065/g.126782  ORF Transcript_49065/g.126782 Transcript_49065/m.126782 type:complete len:104 (-) Transcript_49065:114-425(-)